MFSLFGEESISVSFGLIPASSKVKLTSNSWLVLSNKNLHCCFSGNPKSIFSASRYLRNVESGTTLRISSALPS